MKAEIIREEVDQNFINNMQKLINFMSKVDAELLLKSKEYKQARYMVCGGALRDTLLGRPVKDIDVVVAYKKDWDVEWSKGDYGITGSFSVADLDASVDGYPIQLIYRDGNLDIEATSKIHTTGLANIFWYSGSLIIHPSWVRDVSDRVHTVNKSLNKEEYERAKKYLSKIREKYPWDIRYEL